MREEVIAPQASLSGRQRLRQIRVKVRLIAERERRDFMSGRIPFLPCSGDHERDAICAEFERVYALGFQAGQDAARRALAQEKGGGDG